MRKDSILIIMKSHKITVIFLLVISTLSCDKYNLERNNKYDSLSDAFEPSVPEIYTTNGSELTGNSIKTGGDVTADCGLPVTSRGVCWSTSENPTTIDNKTIDGDGTGQFTSSITGLSINSQYYVRAYATNGKGTSYGFQIFFKTLSTPSVTTSFLTSVTTSSAVSGGNVTSDGGASITASGVCWSTSPNPTADLATKTTDGALKGTYTSEISALTANTVYYLRAYAKNSIGTSYGNELVFKTIHSILVDADGNSYNAIEIGTQLWMTKNLETTKYRDGTSIPNVTGYLEWGNNTTGAYCYYNNSSSNRTLYGMMYNWYAAENSKGLCPTGWHIPSESEWVTLTTFLGDKSVAGGKLKTTGTSIWQVPNTGATNESGFSALPGGYRQRDGDFGGLKYAADFMSTTTDISNSGLIWGFSLRANDSELQAGYREKFNGLSVRCIKD
jgi:uncharacterized protein (TIGR02145 family)